MSIFDMHRRILDAYCKYVESFLLIADEQVREFKEPYAISTFTGSLGHYHTFPFPQGPPSEAKAWAERVGVKYHEHRRQIMLTRHIGLTKTYNLFHNPVCTDTDIAHLRQLHVEMARTILACYSWSDLDPQHGFYQNERGQTRFTIAPVARRTILQRLLQLNFGHCGQY